MTLKESLEICQKMWQYLADHPFEEKDEAVEALELPSMWEDCACCAYARTFDRLPTRSPAKFMTDCSKCPLREFWPEGCETANDEGPFTDYELWCNADGDDPNYNTVREHHAQNIADASEEALKKLEEGE
jgi:hypothetical protein